MPQVLEGNFYQVTPNGYVNKGRETIRFNAQVNHLPIYSRCHQLLKSESHPLNFQKHESLSQVHCYFKSQEIKRPESKFNLSLEKMKKSGENKFDNMKNNVFNAENAAISTPRYKEQPISNDSPANPQTSDIKNTHSEHKSFEEKQFVPKGRKQAQSQIKNPLKQTISMMTLEKELSEKSNNNYKLSTPKTAYNKPGKQENKTLRTESEDGQLTQHNVYEHSDPKKISAYKYKHDNKILGELTNLVNKVGRLQEKIRKNQEQFNKNRILEDIREAELQLAKLQDENTKLKTEVTPCHANCHNSLGLGNNSHLSLFFMFLFGLIFARAVFC